MATNLKAYLLRKKKKRDSDAPSKNSQNSEEDEPPMSDDEEQTTLGSDRETSITSDPQEEQNQVPDVAASPPTAKSENHHDQQEVYLKPFVLSSPALSPASSSDCSANRRLRIERLEQLLHQKDVTIQQQSDELQATRKELQESRSKCLQHKQRAHAIQLKFLKWDRMLQEWMSRNRQKPVAEWDERPDQQEAPSRQGHAPNHQGNDHINVMERKQEQLRQHVKSSSLPPTKEVPVYNHLESHGDTMYETPPKASAALDMHLDASKQACGASAEVRSNQARVTPVNHSPQRSTRSKSVLENRDNVGQRNTENERQMKHQAETAKASNTFELSTRNDQSLKAHENKGFKRQSQFMMSAPESRQTKFVHKFTADEIMQDSDAADSKKPTDQIVVSPFIRQNKRYPVDKALETERLERVQKNPSNSYRSLKTDSPTRRHHALNSQGMDATNQQAKRSIYNSSEYVQQTSQANEQPCAMDSSEKDSTHDENPSCMATDLSEKPSTDKENRNPNLRGDPRRVTMTPVRDDNIDQKRATTVLSQASSVSEESQTQLDPRASNWDPPTRRKVPDVLNESTETSKASLPSGTVLSLENEKTTSKGAESTSSRSRVAPTASIDASRGSIVNKVADGWRSTNPARTFVNEALNAAQVAAAQKQVNPYKHAPNKKDNASTWKTAKKRTNRSLDKDDSSQTQVGDEPNYQYVQVVRGKKQRACLEGHACAECDPFWNAVCDGNEDVFRRRDFQDCSRHRAAFSPHNTPPDFWELSFMDEKREREAKENAQKKSADNREGDTDSSDSKVESQMQL